MVHIWGSVREVAHTFPAITTPLPDCTVCDPREGRLYSIITVRLYEFCFSVHTVFDGGMVLLQTPEHESGERFTYVNRPCDSSLLLCAPVEGIPQ